MRVIKARNVNQAWYQAIEYADTLNPPQSNRNEDTLGKVYVAPGPVITQYTRPTERVLFCPIRDANPFFHLFESLWMLQGRWDAVFLDEFVSDYSARYAEEDVDGRTILQHGAYGKRWRDWFRRTWSGGPIIDQLSEAVRLLKDNPNDRQVVISMWDPSQDLGVQGLKDRPCNTHAYLRIEDEKVCLSVLNRSNDVVWGCYGANAVHFSFLQEYIAGMLGRDVGWMVQFSNNWHVYEKALGRMNIKSARTHAEAPYPTTFPLVMDAKWFLHDLNAYMDNPNEAPSCRNDFFLAVAYPMWKANQARRQKDTAAALAWARKVEAVDWRTAAVAWLERRIR